MKLGQQMNHLLPSVIMKLNFVSRLKEAAIDSFSSLYDVQAGLIAVPAFSLNPRQKLIAPIQKARHAILVEGFAR